MTQKVPSQAVSEVLKKVRKKPLLVLRDEVPPLLIVGQTRISFQRIGVMQGGTVEGKRPS